MLWHITCGRGLLCPAHNGLPEMRLHRFHLWNDVSRLTTCNSHTPCLCVLWMWNHIRVPWRSNLPSRTSALTPRLVGGGGGGTWLTAAASGLVLVRDRTPFLSTPLDRLCSSTGAVGTAVSLASHSGAELATTEVWRLPAGIGAGALQCLSMWPGCWHRWQRTSPVLRRLLGHLPSLCSLSSRRSRLFDIFSSCSKMSFVSESCVAPGADLIVDVGIIGLPFHSKRPMVSLTPCIFAQTTSISGTDGQSSGHLRQGANWVYSVSRAVPYPADNATC